MNKDGSSPFFRPYHPNIMFSVFACVLFFTTDFGKRSGKIRGRILAVGLQRSFQLVSRAARYPSSLALLRCHRNNFSAPFHAKDMRASLPLSDADRPTDGRRREEEGPKGLPREKYTIEWLRDPTDWQKETREGEGLPTKGNGGKRRGGR